MNILDISKVVTIFLLMFFSAFLVSFHQGNRKSNILQGIIIGFFALEALNSSFFRFYEFWMHEYPWVFFTTEFTFYLWGPILYYFFKSASEVTFRFQKKMLLHALPALVHTLYLIFSFHIHSNPEKTAMLLQGAFTSYEIFVIHFGRNLSVVIYLILSYNVLKSYRSAVISIDTPLAHRSAQWLTFIFVFFCIAECIQLAHFVAIEIKDLKPFIYDITNPLWFVLSGLLLFVAMRNPDYFQYVPQEEKEKIKSKIEDGEVETIARKLEDSMIKGQIYKNPELKLVDLADELGLPAKKVSYVINLKYDKNFSDFINYYRVEEAKEKLLHPDSKTETVLSIAFEVGFNSKSSFNRVFQKMTDMTPRDFRKSED